jgi:ribosome-associated toxin RatA of RatAB toxin-antitoxin module
MGQLGGRKSIEVDAPIAACWAVAADTASAPQWQDGLEAMDVLERDPEGRPSLVETTSDAKVRMIKTKVRFAYAEPTLVSWKQEQGDLKRLDGAWELADLGGERTRVTYVLDGDPGMVLGMLIRGPVETRIRETMVDGRPAEFKARVEGAGAPQA